MKQISRKSARARAYDRTVEYRLWLIRDGGGAWHHHFHEKLRNKTLAIIEPREEYKRDKTWSFWKVATHNFDDCVKKNWENFSVNIPGKTNYLECKNFPYQSIDSGLFYEKIKSKLKKNENIFLFKIFLFFRII